MTERKLDNRRRMWSYLGQVLEEQISGSGSSSDIKSPMWLVGVRGKRMRKVLIGEGKRLGKPV